jgi:cation transporter-like permease
MKVLALHQRLRETPLLFSALTAGAASCLSLIGGMGIEAVQGKLLPIIPLIVALPALNTMVGDYAAIIAAHAGDPAERTHTKRQLARAISRAMLVNIIGIIILSLIIAWRRGYVLTGDFGIRFILFIVIAFVGIITAMFAITAVLDRMLEKHRLNPDDILIPIVTTVTDILMLGLISLAVVTIF